MQNYKLLKVWENAHQLALAIYHITAAFPKTEAEGLTLQIRNAALAIPGSIAKGSAYGSSAEFAASLEEGLHSAYELENLLVVARDLRFLDPFNYRALRTGLTQVKRMLTALIKKLKTDD